MVNGALQPDEPPLYETTATRLATHKTRLDGMEKTLEQLFTRLEKMAENDRRQQLLIIGSLLTAVVQLALKLAGK